MKPQDYPNILRMDEELRLIQIEINQTNQNDTKRAKLLDRQGELLKARKKQLEFNVANETKD